MIWICKIKLLSMHISSLLAFDAQTFNLWLTLCTNLSTWLTPATWTDVVGCNVLHFINNEDQEALGYKTLWRINVVASHRENKSLGLCIRVWWPLKWSLYMCRIVRKETPNKYTRLGWNGYLCLSLRIF